MTEMHSDFYFDSNETCKAETYIWCSITFFPWVSITESRLSDEEEEMQVPEVQAESSQEDGQWLWPKSINLLWPSLSGCFSSVKTTGSHPVVFVQMCRCTKRMERPQHALCMTLWMQIGIQHSLCITKVRRTSMNHQYKICISQIQVFFVLLVIKFCFCFPPNQFWPLVSQQASAWVLIILCKLLLEPMD